MNSEFIKYHPVSNTYIIQKKAYFQNSITFEGNLLVGASCNFWQDLIVSGNLELGKNTLVKGNVKADNVLIASSCEIKGDLKVVNDVTLMDKVSIKGAAICGGGMHIRPGCSLNFVKAEKMLELIGKVDIKDIETATKVIVRSE